MPAPNDPKTLLVRRLTALVNYLKSYQNEHHASVVIDTIAFLSTMRLPVPGSPELLCAHPVPVRTDHPVDPRILGPENPIIGEIADRRMAAGRRASDRVLDRLDVIERTINALNKSVSELTRRLELSNEQSVVGDMACNQRINTINAYLDSRLGPRPTLEGS